MAEKIKGMYTCDVCGRDFPLLAEDNYVVREDGRRGLQTVISDTEERMYHAFDCPHCGCQNIVAKFMRPVVIDDLYPADDEHDDCDDCDHHHCENCEVDHGE